MKGVAIMEKGFGEVAKKRYDELLKQRDEIDKELAPLKKYLQNIGILKKAARGRKKKEKAE